MKVAGLLCKGPFIYDVIIYVTYFMQLEGSEKDDFWLLLLILSFPLDQPKTKNTND